MWREVCKPISVAVAMECFPRKAAPLAWPSIYLLMPVNARKAVRQTAHPRNLNCMRHCSSEPPCWRCCSKMSLTAFSNRSRLELEGKEYHITRQLCTISGENVSIPTQVLAWPCALEQGCLDSSCHANVCMAGSLAHASTYFLVTSRFFTATRHSFGFRRCLRAPL